MKKSDIIIEVLSWIAIAAIVWFCLWINYEVNKSDFDSQKVAENKYYSDLYSNL